MNPLGRFICGGCIPGVIANLLGSRGVFQATSVATAAIRMDAGNQMCPLQKAVSAAAGSPPPPKVGCTELYNMNITLEPTPGFVSARGLPRVMVLPSGIPLIPHGSWWDSRRDPGWFRSGGNPVFPSGKVPRLPLGKCFAKMLCI